MKSVRPHINELLRSGCIFSSRDNTYWLGWGESVKGSSPALGKALGTISLYTPDFFLTDPMPWRVFPYSCRLTHSDLSALLLSYEDSISTKLGQTDESIVWKAAEFREFRSAFQDLQEQFERGILKKAVPIVLEEGEFQGSPDSALKYRAKLLYQLVRSTHGFPLYLYGVWDQEEGVLGATPEILFEQTESSRLKTAAIAGTRSRSPQEATSPSLLGDPKELEEHRIVIEGICNSLAELGEVEVGTTRELELPTLVHLMTPVTLAFRHGKQEHKAELGFESAVRRLHPTPALGAFPKAAGQAWLENYPLSSKRKRFGAPFGATWASGESLCVVAIRNIQWQGSRCVIGAGCGVVPASQLEKECDELRAKIRSVKKSFDIL